MNITERSDGAPVNGANVSLSTEIGLWTSSNDSNTVKESAINGSVYGKLTFDGAVLSSNEEQVVIHVDVTKTGYTTGTKEVIFVLYRVPPLIEFSFLAGDTKVEVGSSITVQLQTLKDGYPVAGVKVNVTAQAGYFQDGKTSIIGQTNEVGIFEAVWDTSDISMPEDKMEFLITARVQDSRYEPIVDAIQQKYVLFVPTNTEGKISKDQGDSRLVTINNDIGDAFLPLILVAGGAAVILGIFSATLVLRKLRRD